MAAKRHERTRARREALQVLYTSEITDESAAAIAEGPMRLAEDGPLPEYALTLVRGVEAHRCAIDGHLSATSENWSLARMPVIDRSILRLAAYEMMYVDDVPTSVAINEAVELAKDFGGEDESPRFVNGVLGRIAKRLEEAVPSVASACDEGVACARDAQDGTCREEVSEGRCESPSEGRGVLGAPALADGSLEGGRFHGA
ncbi:transcription antitermination factor NusB [Gordonibacter sp. An230]|uniref:transcription antitermination factor NusB n=1 Tax=Gordonibacter sp. An230 TaxID=1965592 RepID=UPI001EF54957|nr:transcription antitermination factor NusB [Gordonibacter sp. An230]